MSSARIESGIAWVDKAEEPGPIRKAEKHRRNTKQLEQKEAEVIQE